MIIDIPLIINAATGGGGGGDPLALFEADFSQTTLATIGFTTLVSDDDSPNFRCTRSIVTNGGPSGSKQAIRWQHHPKSVAFVTGLGNPQGSWGQIESNVQWTPPGPGEDLFLHFYLRVVEANNCDSIGQGFSVVGNDLKQKTIDIGGGVTGSSRFILYSGYGQRGGIGALNSWTMRCAVGTAESAVECRPTGAMGWVSCVFQIRPATSLGGSNGIFRAALNRDAGWDSENIAVSIDDHEGASSWNGINFMSFSDATLGDADGVGPSLIVEMGGCKVRRTRDTSWFANMAA